jgi:hypothetical protein
VIRNMFIDNGDGTWTVRFFNGTTSDYVTVDRYLPAYNGQFVYANSGISVTDPTNVLWVALAEKAYVELNESGWLGHSPVNSYEGISEGLIAKATNQIAGVATDSASVVGATFASFTALFDAGNYVLFGSNATGIADNVVPSHAYMMAGYDAAAQTVTLFNPWGVGGGDMDGTHRDGFLTLSMTDLVTNFGAYSFKT